MKRRSSTTLALMMSFAFAGCGGSDSTDAPTSTTSTTPTTPIEQPAVDELEQVPEPAVRAARRFAEAIHTTAPQRARGAYRIALETSGGALRRSLQQAGAPTDEALRLQREDRVGGSGEVIDDVLARDENQVAGTLRVRVRTWDQGAIHEQLDEYRVDLRRVNGQWRVFGYSMVDASA